MVKIKVAWNRNKSKSVVLSKLKEFSIKETISDGSFIFGWYNKENSFIFGAFVNKKEAVDYLKNLYKAAKIKVGWNEDNTKSVVLSKIKEFSIDPKYIGERDLFLVQGWYNKENSFIFGTFDSESKAMDYLEGIHKLV